MPVANGKAIAVRPSSGIVGWAGRGAPKGLEEIHVLRGHVVDVHGVGSAIGRHQAGHQLGHLSIGAAHHKKGRPANTLLTQTIHGRDTGDLPWIVGILAGHFEVCQRRAVAVLDVLCVALSNGGAHQTFHMRLAGSGLRVFLGRVHTFQVTIHLSQPFDATAHCHGVGLAGHGFS